MKFGEYVKSLNEFLKDYPECSDMKTVYAGDDEGNSYEDVLWFPSRGHLDDDDDGGWYQDEDLEGKEINAVCIN